MRGTNFWRAGRRARINPDNPNSNLFFSLATTALLCRSSRVGAFHTRPAYTSREGNVVQHRAGAAANQSTPPAMVFPNDWEGFSPAIMGRVMDCEFCSPSLGPIRFVWWANTLCRCCRSLARTPHPYFAFDGVYPYFFEILPPVERRAIRATEISGFAEGVE